MARKDVEQFNLRLNLNNPNHLKIYRTFQDLNTDIHKSRNNFIIEALLRYINGSSEEALTISGAKKKQEEDGFVTRSELAGLENRITTKVMKEVAEFMSRAALNSQSIMNPFMMQSYMQMGQEARQAPQKEREADTGEVEEADPALKEMSLLFSQGDFGEE